MQMITKPVPKPTTVLAIIAMQTVVNIFFPL